MEKEALSIIFALKHFHHYIFGRNIIIQTDHRPLLTLLGPRNKVSAHTLSRINRWALLLAEYSYEIEYVPTHRMKADFFSRAPVDEAPLGPSEVDRTINAVTSQTLEAIPVDARQLEISTRHDPVLSKVMALLTAGWPEKDNNLEPEVQQFGRFRGGLQIVRGILMFGPRVVVPAKWRPQLLEELHISHQGVVRMKSKARQYIFWPKL